MSEYQAQQHKDRMAAEERNCAFYPIDLEIDAKKIIESAISAWGEQIQSSNAAPSWTRVDPVVSAIAKAKVPVQLVVDDSGQGMIESHYSEAQSAAIASLVEDLVSLAERSSCPAERIAAARVAFDQATGQFEFFKPFNQETAPAAVAEFLARADGLILDMEHSEYGWVVKDSDFEKLATNPPLRPGQEPAPEPEPDPSAPPPKKRYQSMGQMVKEGDAEALKEIIASTKAAGSWDESRQEMVDKLLWHAAAAGHLDCVKVLTQDAEASMTEMDTNGTTVFLAACLSNNPDLVDHFVANGANINECDVDGHTALMLAAEKDADLVVQKLIDLGADIQETTIEGRTALHLACLGIEGKTSNKAVQILMDAGADPTVVDDAECCLAEEYVDAESGQTKADLMVYRDAWEKGQKGPRKSPSLLAKARATFGI